MASTQGSFMEIKLSSESVKIQELSKSTFEVLRFHNSDIYQSPIKDCSKSHRTCFCICSGLFNMSPTMVSLIMLLSVSWILSGTSSILKISSNISFSNGTHTTSNLCIHINSSCYQFEQNALYTSKDALV